MIQKLALPLVPSLHAGHGLLVNDAILFHETAAEIAARINTLGWSEWSLWPANFTGNVGSLGRGGFFRGEPAGMGHGRRNRRPYHSGLVAQKGLEEEVGAPLNKAHGGCSSLAKFYLN